MVGDGFAIMIAIDRFDIEIYYLYKKERDVVKYPCGSFFAQAYDSQDRENLLSGEGSDIYIKNCLLITIQITNYYKKELFFYVKLVKGFIKVMY